VAALGAGVGSATTSMGMVSPVDAVGLLAGVGRGPAVPVVDVAVTVTVAPLLWTGVELLALRLAVSMSVREFAEYLGVSDRTVSKWEVGGASVRPLSVNQAAAYTCLERATPLQRALFTAWVLHDGDVSPGGTGGSRTGMS
jgi:Helix-turn-helix